MSGSISTSSLTGDKESGENSNTMPHSTPQNTQQDNDEEVSRPNTRLSKYGIMIDYIEIL